MHRRSCEATASVLIIALSAAFAPGQEPSGASSKAKKPADSAEARRARAAPQSNAIEKGNKVLLELQRKLRALEVDALERRRNTEARLAEAAFEKRTLERSTAALTQEAASLEKEVQAQKENLAKNDSEAKKLNAELSKVSAAVKKYLSAVDKHIESGIPWMKEERKLAVQTARDQLTDAGAAPADTMALAEQIQVSEEMLGRSVEPGALKLNVDGVERSLPAFRLGLLALAYASDDGTTLGYVHAGQKLEEGRIESPGGAASKGSKDNAIAKVAAGYKTALLVLRRKVGPRLIDLYIPSLPLGGEEAPK